MIIVPRKVNTSLPWWFAELAPRCHAHGRSLFVFPSLGHRPSRTEKNPNPATWNTTLPYRVTTVLDNKCSPKDILSHGFGKTCERTLSQNAAYSSARVHVSRSCMQPQPRTTLSLYLQPHRVGDCLGLRRKANLGGGEEFRFRNLLVF